MYTVKQLSGYQLDVANIIDVSTGEMMQKETDNTYKLLTDETVYLESKDKTIRLWRRFTREQLTKMIEQSGTPVNNGTAKMGQATVLPESGTELMGQDELPTRNGTAFYSINGTDYETLRQASEATGTSKSTLERWFNSGKEGYIKLG